MGILLGLIRIILKRLREGLARWRILLGVMAVLGVPGWNRRASGSGGAGLRPLGPFGKRPQGISGTQFPIPGQKDRHCRFPELLGSRTVPAVENHLFVQQRGDNDSFSFTKYRQGPRALIRPFEQAGIFFSSSGLPVLETSTVKRPDDAEAASGSVPNGWPFPEPGDTP